MVMRIIKRGIRILSNPEKEFEELNKRTLEGVVGDYIKLLVLVSVAAGLTSFLYSLIKVLYFDVTLNVDIQYFRMINYSFGRSIALTFFYLFSGTFLLFFLSLITRPFLRKINYTSILKIFIYSLTPMLLFGWIFSNPLPLLVWTAFLILIGVKNYKHLHIKKDSIHKRY